MPHKIRPIRVEGNIAYVPLTRGYEAVIDAADVAMVEGRNWCAVVDRRGDGSIRAVYAMRKERTEAGEHRFVMMHRVIAETPDAMETDHIDGDGLNNRRDNMRNATRSQNQHNQGLAAHNTSGFKGVTWHKARAKWRAQIKINGKQRYLGMFGSLESASAAYAAASAELHGEFGRAR